MALKKQSKALLYPAIIVLTVNLILFSVKLFIGLSSNSISVYSDAVNNLFDSLSGILTLGSVFFAGSGYFKKKTEQLLSFIIACFIGFSGIYFLYSSFERLMYPTPVWYTQKYFILLCATTAVKLLLYFVLKKTSAKNSSPVTRLMATDSLLDFFIGLTTLLTLLLSKSGNYAFDAICGIVISIVIIVSAVKSTVNAVKQLINYADKEKREKIEQLLTSEEKIKAIYHKEFIDENICLVTAEIYGVNDAQLQAICNNIKEQTDIQIIFKQKGK